MSIFIQLLLFRFFCIVEQLSLFNHALSSSGDAAVTYTDRSLLSGNLSLSGEKER